MSPPAASVLFAPKPIPAPEVMPISPAALMAAGGGEVERGVRGQADVTGGAAGIEDGGAEASVQRDVADGIQVQVVGIEVPVPPRWRSRRPMR